MIFPLLAAIAAAFGAVGVTLLVFRLMGRKAPAGTTPLVAAAAMIAMAIWNESTWFSRTSAELPNNYVIVQTGTYSGILQPWTLLFPRVNRFVLVETDTVLQNSNAPEIRTARILLMQRFQPALTVRQLFDCAENKQADLTDKTVFDASGMPQDVAWQTVDEADPMLRAVCDQVVGT